MAPPGSVVAWGRNDFGQCNVPAPNTGFIATAAGVGYALGLRADADGDGVPDVLDACPNTVPGAPVDASGCPSIIPFDFNRDGDVDGDDLKVFLSCYTGPAIAGPPSGCPASTFQAADRDHDGDVDASDFGLFQRCYNGTNRYGNPVCAN